MHLRGRGVGALRAFLSLSGLVWSFCLFNLGLEGRRPKHELFGLKAKGPNKFALVPAEVSIWEDAALKTDLRLHRKLYNATRSAR